MATLDHFLHHITAPLLHSLLSVPFGCPLQFLFFFFLLLLLFVSRKCLWLWGATHSLLFRATVYCGCPVGTHWCDIVSRLTRYQSASPCWCAWCLVWLWGVVEWSSWVDKCCFLNTPFDRLPEAGDRPRNVCPLVVSSFTWSGLVARALLQVSFLSSTG